MKAFKVIMPIIIIFLIVMWIYIFLVAQAGVAIIQPLVNFSVIAFSYGHIIGIILVVAAVVIAIIRFKKTKTEIEKKFLIATLVILGVVLFIGWLLVSWSPEVYYALIK